MLLFKMADKLRPDELQAFKGAFDMFDRNGDGTISTKVSTYSYVPILRTDLINLEPTFF